MNQKLTYLSPNLTQEKRAKMAGMYPISGDRLRGRQLGQAMNWVDRLRIIADERVLSGRRAVMGCCGVWWFFVDLFS